MARKTTDPNRPALDVKALARGIGKVQTSAGYDRIVVGKRTLAYVKRGGTVTIPYELIKGAPRKLGRFAVEANGRWAGAKVADTAQARQILEYVAARKEER